MIEEILQDVDQVLVMTFNPNGPVSEFLNKKAVYSPSPNTSQLAARMKVRRTLRSLGEGGLKGFEEFRKDTSELCSEELHLLPKGDSHDDRSSDT